RRGNDHRRAALGLNIEIETRLEIPTSPTSDRVDGQVNAVVELPKTAPQTTAGGDGMHVGSGEGRLAVCLNQHAGDLLSSCRDVTISPSPSYPNGCREASQVGESATRGEEPRQLYVMFQNWKDGEAACLLSLEDEKRLGPAWLFGYKSGAMPTGMIRL